MSLETISIRGPIGLDAVEPKVTGFAELGPARPEDIVKFTESLTGRTMELGGMRGVSGAEGPFEVQPTRLKRIPGAEEEMSLGERVISDIGRGLKAGRAQEVHLKQMLEEAGEAGMSPIMTIRLQKLVGDMGLFVEIISKGVNKVVQAVQSLAKNQ